MGNRTLNVFLDTIPKSLDGLHTESFAQWTVVYNLADRLLEFGAHGELVGNLASSWESLGSDGKKWRFTLASGRRFHDGSAVDVAAVVISLQRSASSSTMYGSESNFFDPKGIYAESDTTLIVTATKSDPSVLEQLNMNAFAIRKDSAGGALYSGPYMVAELTAKKICLSSVFEHPSLNIDSYKSIVICKVDTSPNNNSELLASGDSMLLSRHGLALDRLGLPAHARMFPFAAGNSHVLSLRPTTPHLDWIKASIHEVMYKRSILSSVSHARPLNSFFPPGYVVHAPEVPLACAKPNEPVSLKISVPLDIAHTLALDALSRELKEFDIKVEWIKTDQWEMLGDIKSDLRDGFIGACYLDNQDPVRLATHYFLGPRRIIEKLPEFVEVMLTKSKAMAPGLDRDRIIRNFFKAVIRETPCLPLYFCPMVAWSSGDVNISDLEYYGNTFKFSKVRVGTSLAKNAEAMTLSLRMFAHDFKRPFSLIKTAGRLIENATTIEDIRRISESLLPQMNQAMTSVDGMIKGLLNTEDSAVPDLRCDLGLAIKNAIDQSKASHSTDEQKISYPTIQDQVFVYGSQIDLERIFANLVHNALEATPESGRVWVNTILTTDSQNDSIEIRVGNSGSYIEPELREQLFVPGFSRKGSDRGLGLGIVQSLVQKINGSISVRSTVADGTEFCICLPVLEVVEAACSELRSEDRNWEKMFSNVSLVLVEDDPFIREAWEMIWRQDDIHTFADLEALQTAITAGIIAIDANTVVVTDYFFENSRYGGKDVIAFARTYKVRSVLLASDYSDPEIDTLVNATIGKMPISQAEGRTLWPTPWACTNQESS